ncbi:transposase IS3/IS911 family protein (plasmid) [Methylobacterium nodulans ORS 2060]|uniref:Transposase IS3/IS911 family protein n=1 Tax=Methylobacterium nodulans (strain LMG 21967 / CNCM I-2342 / ORS 2060) TaxID=460265 RepID=B8IXR0_METNO|nr:transposase IS3/IS911 family protein [Methylobacterium nodulans ORS 2060]
MLCRGLASPRRTRADPHLVASLASLQRATQRYKAIGTKKHKPEEVVAKLRQVNVLVSQGHSVADAIRAIGVSEVTYYRWRKEFGGLKTDQVRRMRELETENARLRKAIADLTLDKLILQEEARGNF